jgi:hypothetical protein
MILLRITGMVVAFGSIPCFAVIVLNIVRAADCMLGETIPSSSGKRGLVIGMMEIWGTVLFGFLVCQTERLACKITEINPFAPSEAEVDPIHWTKNRVG